MKLIKKNVIDFLSVLSSKSPTPGGGSVSALAGANATSLVLMVINLTINKKKFKALPDEEKELYFNEIESFKEANELFIKYIDEDTEAFNQVMAAYKLPKVTEEQTSERKTAIEKATIISIKTPIKISALALRMMRKLDIIIKNSNRNTISDQGVSILLFYTTCIGGILNVKSNLIGLSQKDLITDYKNVIIDMENEVNELKESLLEKVNYFLK